MANTGFSWEFYVVSLPWLIFPIVGVREITIHIKMQVGPSLPGPNYQMGQEVTLSWSLVTSLRYLAQVC